MVIAKYKYLSTLLEMVTKYCNLLEIMLMYTFSNLQLL